MGLKNMPKYPPFLITRDMQITTAMRYTFYISGWHKSESLINILGLPGWGAGTFLHCQ